MEGMQFTQNRQNTRSFGEIFGGKSYAAARAGRMRKLIHVVVLMSPPIPFPDLKRVGVFFSELKFRVFCYS